MESPDAGTPEVVAPMEKKTEKPKRETRMMYGDNEISPVSHTHHSLYNIRNRELTFDWVRDIGGKESFATEVRVSSSQGIG